MVVFMVGREGEGEGREREMEMETGMEVGMRMGNGDEDGDGDGDNKVQLTQGICCTLYPAGSLMERYPIATTSKPMIASKNCPTTNSKIEYTCITHIHTYIYV